MPAPAFDCSRPFYSFPALAHHHALKEKLEQARAIFESSPFNFYWGAKDPQLIVVATGTSWLYTREAVQLLGAQKSIGVIKLGATWPLATDFLCKHLSRTDKVLVAEEVETFVECHIQALCARHLEPKRFFGRETGLLPTSGELSVDKILGALRTIIETPYEARPTEYAQKAHSTVSKLVPARQMGFCAGCPHRATYWAIKNALALDGREGIVLGDIGCYSLGFGPSGFHQLSTLHAMGSGPGLATGMSQLKRFGLSQPVITLVGDSTFYHAALPALINGRYNKSSFLLLVLDNSATAMTGFQPHPGIGVDAMGAKAPVVAIEDICRAMGFNVVVGDPFQMDQTITTILELIEDQSGINVLVLRRTCGLITARKRPADFIVRVDTQRCRGDACGCNRLCTRVFRCPGLTWEKEKGRATIDEAICNRCGYCTQICPASAIVKLPLSDKESL